MIYTISTGQQKDVQPADVILVMPGLFESNLFDVSAVIAVDVSSPTEILILQLDRQGVTYGDPIHLSPTWVLDVWRRLA